ncbi:MAG: hypothetical protein V2A65_01825 [Candidatus Omnitrophota bacterium]
MGKVMVEIDSRQVENIIRQLGDEERQRMIEKFVEEEFDQSVKRLRENIKSQKLSLQDVENIVKKSRKEYYAQSCA